MLYTATMICHILPRWSCRHFPRDKQSPPLPILPTYLPTITTITTIADRCNFGVTSNLPHSQTTTAMANNALTQSLPFPKF